MKFRCSCFTQATVLCFVLVALSLVACASNGKQWNPDDYTVKSGDTIYSIAWRYELDPEAFAAWNGMGVSKRLKPGQRLHTRKPHGFVSSPSSGATRPSASSDKGYSNKKWVTVKKGDSLSLISQRTGVSISRLAQLNQLKKPYVIQPGQTIFLKPITSASSAASLSAKSSTSRSTSKGKYKKSGSSSSSQSYKKKQTGASATSWPKTVHWKRPANGKLVKKFNASRNDAKGIDIQGKRGDTIVASAGGKIVYSGNGLISYGNLIIIKHNNTYLSAYAYNRKLLVKEGDSVSAGQKIAEMGSKDKLGARLHFEIRKNGKPVDPLKYLPW